MQSTESAPVSIQRVASLDDSNVDGAIRVLVEAFRNDVVRKAITEGDEDLLLMMHSAAARAAIVGGYLYVALNDSGVVGTASWFPPGSGFLDSEEQMDQGMKEFGARLASLKPDVFQWYAKLLASYQNFCKKAFGSADDPTGVNFKRDNWKINSFAVLPSYQGRGIGKLLLEIGERQAAAEKKSVCLEANVSNHVAIYEHFGYNLVAQELVEGPPGKVTFSQYAFLKTPVDS